MKGIIELEDGWAKIQEHGIKKLINILEFNDQTEFDKKEFILIYTMIYNMCTQPRRKNFSSQIYDRFGEVIENYIADFIIKKISQQCRSLEFLSNLNDLWKKYLIMIKWLKIFFNYIDRHHVSQNNLLSLQDLSLKIFRIRVAEPIKNRIVDSFFEILIKNGEGEDNERELLRNIYLMLYAVDSEKLYNSYFCTTIKKKILEDIYEFYPRLKFMRQTENNLLDYLKKAEAYCKKDKIKHDRFGIRYIIGEESANSLILKFFENLINENLNQLLEKDKGMIFLLENNLRQDLLRLYILTSNLNMCKEKISSILNKFVVFKGEEIITEKIKKNKNSTDSSSEDPEFIKALIDFIKYFKNLVEESFQNDLYFQSSINSAFFDILNKQIGQYTFEEILACYLDNLLKNNNTRMSEDEVEVEIVNVIELFKHIVDKLLFAEIFMNQLAKRLLNNLSANYEAEHSIILKMKNCCMLSSFIKMEGMIQDLKLCNEIESNFKNSQVHQSELPIDFSVKVLTYSHWPAFKKNIVRLPIPLQECIEKFKIFYSFKYPSKKLNWMISLGTVELTKMYDSGKYDIACSTIEGLTLMLFNENLELSFNEIKDLMDFDDKFCKKILNIFINPKLKILEKFPDNKKRASEEDVFRVNSRFFSKIKMVKLLIPSQDNNYDKNKVFEDRKYSIDSALVRIMKLRKKMGHSSLISEVISVLQEFRPEVSEIKNRIENLIIREFLERDIDDRNQYNYLG